MNCVQYDFTGDVGDPVHHVRALAVREWRLSALYDWEGVIKVRSCVGCFC